jgi:twitching motility protein PilT
MSGLDAMLDGLLAGAGRSLRLATGSPARMQTAEGPQDVSGQSMTRQEILQLILPLMPEHARRRLPQDNSVDFDYASPAGPFKVTVVRNGSEVAVNIVPDSAAVPSPVAVPPPIMPAAAGVTLPPLPPEERRVEREPVRTEPATVATAGNAIDRLFRLMVEAKASDLHISTGMPPLVRKDGHIRALEDGAAALTDDEVAALLAPITPEPNRAEFAEHSDTDFAYEVRGLARFRANMFMDRKGRGAVFRVIPAKILTSEELGLSPHILKLCKLNKGLVLVTGPTGSGKSTTLCAMIDYINRTRTDHIITIEDPIEFVHDNKGCLINQREVGTHTGGFKKALRAAMREDPDIILVGELRDLETVAIAIETAETGHLVFGTLHTTTAASTVDRVIDQFPTAQQAQIRIMLSESLKGVIAQNLCRKIGGGRAAALEVLLVNSAIANLIREAKTFQIPSMMQVGRAHGMVALNDALMDLVAKKLVEPEEAYLKSVDKAAFEGLLKRANIDTKFVQAVAS